MTAPSSPGGYRLLEVSVRGHCYLVGNPTAHPVDVVPPGVGTRFFCFVAIERYLRSELRGISSIWQVRVIDDDAIVLWLGFRAGFNGTGETWTWRLATTPIPTDDSSAEADL